MAAPAIQELSRLSDTPYTSCLDDTKPQSPEITPRHLDSARQAVDPTSGVKSAISSGLGRPATAASEKKPPSKLAMATRAGNFHSDHDDLHGGNRMLTCITTYAVAIIIVVIVLIAYLVVGARVNRAHNEQVAEGAKATGRNAVTRVSVGSTRTVPKAKPHHANDHASAGGRHYDEDVDVDVRNKNIEGYSEDEPASNGTTREYEN